MKIFKDIFTGMCKMRVYCFLLRKNYWNTNNNNCNKGFVVVVVFIVYLNLRTVYFSGDELFSDTFPIEEVDQVVYKVKGKVTKYIFDAVLS